MTPSAKLRRIKKADLAVEKPKLRRVTKKPVVTEKSAFVKGECDAFFDSTMKCGLGRKHNGKHQHKNTNFLVLWLDTADRCYARLAAGQAPMCSQEKGHVGDHIYTHQGDIISWHDGIALDKNYRPLKK